jgi:hypothetical protein
MLVMSGLLGTLELSELLALSELSALSGLLGTLATLTSHRFFLQLQTDAGQWICRRYPGQNLPVNLHGPAGGLQDQSEAGAHSVHPLFDRILRLHWLRERLKKE